MSFNEELGTVKIAGQEVTGYKKWIIAGSTILLALLALYFVIGSIGIILGAVFGVIWAVIVGIVNLILSLLGFIFHHSFILLLIAGGGLVAWWLKIKVE